MRFLWVCSILTLALLSFCCGRRDSSKLATSKQETGSVVADVNALHGDFIAELKRRRNWSGPDAFEKCVLEPETTMPEEPWSWDWVQAKFPGLERGTYDNFSSENERARPIAPLDRGAMKLHILTRAEAEEFDAILYDDNRTDYWDVFRNRHGKAVRVGLSAPGFSEDRQQALIYYEASFDWLAAWGSYCFLKRKGDRWEIAEEVCVWQS